MAKSATKAKPASDKKAVERIEHEGLLDVRGLTTFFKLGSGDVRAVQDVSFALKPGESLGLAGESGCGKTTAALSLLKLLPENGRIVSGEVLFDGKNLAKRTEYGMSKIRWKEISIIFQGAMNALNPVKETGKQIAEPIQLHEGLSEKQAMVRVRELLRPGRHQPQAGDGLPAPALGRHAPARHDRHVAGVQSQAGHRRRADHGARRHGAGADPRAHRAPAQGARPLVHPHQPRPLASWPRPATRASSCTPARSSRAAPRPTSSTPRRTRTRGSSSRASPTSTRSARWCARSRATRPTSSTRRRAATSARAATTGSPSARPSTSASPRSSPGHFVRCVHARKEV